MFYEGQENNSPFLRLGDIIGGFHYINPSFPEFQEDVNSFRIDFEFPDHFAVLTPCCSIDEGSISIAPLKKLWFKLFENPNFIKDFTSINRQMSPEKMVAPHVWDHLPESERTKRMGSGVAYSNNNIFIFKENEFLQSYSVGSVINNKPIKHETGCYYVNFKDICSIRSPKILLKTPFIKILQLNISSREQLRNKLSHYYARIPEEDKQAN
jgi:hypothetical protein